MWLSFTYYMYERFDNDCVINQSRHIVAATFCYFAKLLDDFVHRANGRQQKQKIKSNISMISLHSTWMVFCLPCGFWFVLSNWIIYFMSNDLTREKKIFILFNIKSLLVYYTCLRNVNIKFESSIWLLHIWFLMHRASQVNWQGLTIVHMTTHMCGVWFVPVWKMYKYDMTSDIICLAIYFSLTNVNSANFVYDSMMKPSDIVDDYYLFVLIHSDCHRKFGTYLIVCVDVVDRRRICSVLITLRHDHSRYWEHRRAMVSYNLVN